MFYELGFKEIREGNSTIIYYMTYAKSSSVPVKITLSFGEEFFR